MKVLHLNNHIAHKGGVESYILSLLPMLEARGVETRVMYGSGVPEEGSDTVSVPSISAASFQMDRAARREVEEVLHKIRPDVIHVHNVENVGALEACLSYGRTVMTAHDYRAVCPANTFYFRKTDQACQRKGAGPGCFAETISKHCLTRRPRLAAYFYHRARWWTANGARFSRLIAGSHRAGERLARAGVDHERIEVVPMFCPVPPSVSPRAMPERRTITFLGRTTPNKGVRHFIKAVGYLPKDVRGLVVGNVNEEDRQALRDFSAGSGAAERVELRGWASADEVREILDQTSVFVFPSTWPETLGLVGLEALSRGVPVVASNIGGVEEWLKEGETGFLVPPGDARAIATSVSRLLDSPELNLEMGRRGIDLIRRKFTPERHVDLLLEVYQRAGQTGSGRTALAPSSAVQHA